MLDSICALGAVVVRLILDNLDILVDYERKVNELREKMVRLEHQKTTVQRLVDVAREREQDIKKEVTGWISEVNAMEEAVKAVMKVNATEEEDVTAVMALDVTIQQNNGCLQDCLAHIRIAREAQDKAVVAIDLLKERNNFGDTVSIPPAPRVIESMLPVEAANVERRLRDIANEKPIRFSPSQLAALTKDYSTVLGSGGFGIVYKGELLPNGVPLAIKVLNGTLSKQVEEQFMAEINTIGRTYHVNLVRLYGFCFDPTRQALVYEYMENGSLDKFLYGENRTAVGWEKLFEIAIGTAKGIAYLHEECHQRIIHYDIKPGNVLLDSKLCPKVADFGMAKLCNQDSTHVTMTGYRGTPGYAAPELYMPFPVTHKCDVYSFGMLLFEILGRRKNHNPNLSESQQWLPMWTWEKYEKGELKELMELCGIEEEEEDKRKAERICLVALWCAQHSPQARPLMSTVVKMLEGDVEIVPPPNPFQFLVSACFDLTTSTGSNEDSTFPSSSSKEPTEKASSTIYHTPIERTLEIEVAK